MPVSLVLRQMPVLEKKEKCWGEYQAVVNIKKMDLIHNSYQQQVEEHQRVQWWVLGLKERRV